MRYFSFLKKKGTDLSHISTFLGKVNTNQGIGFCFELVRNQDEKISLTLRESLENQIFSFEDIQPKLDELKQYLINNGICIRDISPSNIICQDTNQGINLIIIDGVGNSNLNPLTIRFTSLIHSAIFKAWTSLDRKIARIEKSLNRTDS